MAEDIREVLTKRIRGILDRPKSEGVAKRLGFHPSGKEPGLQAIDGRQGIHFREGTVPHPTKKNHMDGGTTEIYSGNNTILLDQQTSTTVVKSPNLILFGKNVSLAASDISKISIQGKTINPAVFGEAGERSNAILMPTDYFATELPTTNFVMGTPGEGQIAVSLFDMFELPSTFLVAESDDSTFIYLSILKEWVNSI